MKPWLKKLWKDMWVEALYVWASLTITILLSAVAFAVLATFFGEHTAFYATLPIMVALALLSLFIGVKRGYYHDRF